MMMVKMPKDQMEHIIHKLYHKRNTKLEGFVINYALIVVAWLISMIPGFNDWLAHFTNGCPIQANNYMMDMLGLWKVLGVVFFLVPGLAAWWELCRWKKRM
jgi:hypothetical protein